VVNKLKTPICHVDNEAKGVLNLADPRHTVRGSGRAMKEGAGVANFGGGANLKTAWGKNTKGEGIRPLENWIRNLSLGGRARGGR